MKVLFVIPRIFANYPGALNPHLGVGYLAAVLLRDKTNVKIVDMQLGYKFGYLLNVINGYKPDLIGVTMFSFSFIETYKLINRLKDIAKCPIVVGGCHVSSFRKTVLEDCKADFAIFGEGEYSLVKLCKMLSQKKKDFKKINGLIYRGGNKIIEDTPTRLIENLDELPFPAYEKFELKKYSYYIDKRLPITTSRGCPFLCVYCSANLTVGRGFRPRSPENVVEEIGHWYKQGFRVFEFVDDCFNFDMDRAKQICDLIVKKELKIEWRCGNGIRADRVDEELLRKMKKAGCTFTSYGLESGNSEVLKEMKKAITLKKAVETFKLTKKVGLTFAVNFIIGHKNETYKKAMDSVRFASKIPADYVNFHNMMPYPGTELYEYIKQNGRFILPAARYLTDTATKVERPVFETSEFSLKEREIALRKGMALTRKTHLRCRLGLFSSILWPLVKNEKIWHLSRRFVMGTTIGRKAFNLLRVS